MVLRFTLYTESYSELSVVALQLKGTLTVLMMDVSVRLTHCLRRLILSRGIL